MRVIDLPFRVKAPMLACGADMKGAFALAKGDKAYLVEGFGPLDDPVNLNAYESSIRTHEKRLRVRPVTVIRDLHPGYFSGKFAEAHAGELGARICDVQHHEAHIASAVTENRIKTDVIGVAFDGTGYGLDGCIWGGEFFIGSPGRFVRAAHFDYMPMPGGDAVVKEPWRMALSYLYKIFGAKLLKSDIDALKKLKSGQWQILKKMIDGNINSPLTSSAGRLFDAVASIILSKATAGYEAELPIKLEKIADRSCDVSYKFDVDSSREMLIVDMSPLIRRIVSDMARGMRREIISAKFHNTISEVIADLAVRISRREPHPQKVVLSGGVFQNECLMNKTSSLLNENGFEVYSQSSINTNDYGIPIGQLTVASARKSCA